MKLKLKPGQLFINLWRAYAVPALLAAALFVLCVVQSCLEGPVTAPVNQLLARISTSCWLGLCLSTAVCTLTKPGRWNYILSGAAACAGILLHMLLPEEEMLLSGLIAAALALCFHGVSWREAPAVRLNQVLGWFFACVGLALVLWGALAVIVLAVFSLFFSGAGTTALYLAYDVVMYLCWLLFAPWMFLGGLPTQDTPLDKRGAFRKFNAKVMLPLALLLMAVLLAYVAKIVVTWTMPVGTMNGFALAALCLFTFFHLTLTGEEGRIAAFFKKWGAWLMLPVLAAQQVGVWIRVSAYGLTEARVVGVVVTVLCAGVVVTALLKKRASWFFIASAAAAFIFIATPLSADNIARVNQEDRLEAALNRNQMIAEDGSILANADADTDDQAIIWSSMDYLLTQDAPEGSITEQLRIQLTELDDKDELYAYNNYTWYSNSAKCALLGFTEPGYKSTSAYWTFNGTANHDMLSVAGYEQAQWISIEEYEVFNNGEEYTPAVPSDGGSYATFDISAVVEALGSVEGAFVFPEVDLTCMIDGEHVDLRPLMQNLTDNTSPSSPYDHRFTLVDDQLTLPSGRVFHVDKIYLRKYDYTTSFSISVTVCGWLLTPEVE